MSLWASTLSGVFIGAFISANALSLQLIYRSNRILHVAQLIPGLVALVVSEFAKSQLHLGTTLSIALGLACSIVIGIAFNLLALAKHPRRSVLYLLGAILSLALILDGLASGLEARYRLWQHQSSIHFSSITNFSTGGIHITYGDIATLVIAIVFYWYLDKSPRSYLAGSILDANIDSPKQASRLGLRVQRIHLRYWVLVSFISGVVGISANQLIGTPHGSLNQVWYLLIPVLAAFSISGHKKVAPCFYLSFLIGIFQSIAIYRLHFQALSVTLIMSLLVLAGTSINARWKTQTSYFDDFRFRQPFFNLSRTLPRSTIQTVLGSIAYAAVSICLVVFARHLGTPTLIFMSYSCIFALAMLALSISSNWGSRVNFGQLAISFICAASTSTLLMHIHLDGFIAIILGALVGALISLFMEFTSISVDYKYYSQISFVLAVVIPQILYSHNYLSWIDLQLSKRPKFLGSLALNTPWHLFALSLITLAIIVFLIHNLKVSRPGRMISVSKDNLRISPTFAISFKYVKVVVAVISGLIAGTAGTLYLFISGSLAIGPHLSASLSLAFVLVLMVGGSSSLFGAVLSGALFEVTIFFLTPDWQLVVIGLSSLIVLTLIGQPLETLAFRLSSRKLAKSLSEFTLGSHSQPGNSQSSKTAIGFNSPTFRRNMKLPLEQKSLQLVVDEILGLELLEASLKRNSQLASTFPSERILHDPQSSAPGVQGTELLGCSGLSLIDGSRRVLQDIDFSLYSGEIVAIVGSNGSGKSSMLEVFSGDRTPSSGILRYRGKRLTRLNGVERAEAGLITAFHDRSVFPSLSVQANLELATWMLRRDAPAQQRGIEWVLNIFPILQARLDVSAGDLSSGERQMLSIAQSLLCRPRVLLVDEISQGLAPHAVSKINETLKELASGGVGIVLAEQSFNLSTSIADRVLLLENGRIVFSGPPPELSTRADYMRSVFARSAARQSASSPARHEGSSPLNQSASSPARHEGSSPLAKEKGSINQPRRDYVQTSILSARSIYKSYGGINALTDVNLTAYPGEVLGIIGSNGSGKTTLLDVCSGITSPQRGQIRMLGSQITKMPSHKRARMGLARSFQNSQLFPNLTPFQVLASAIETPSELLDPLSYALRLKPARQHDKFVTRNAFSKLEEFGLLDLANQPISMLSGLEKRLLEIACVLSHNPRILLLDEPTVGVSQRQRGALGDLLALVRLKSHSTIVIVEHDIPLISQLADSMICLHLGRVISSGSPEQVLSDQHVIDSYLGVLESSH